jgi:hypothetical protein
VQRVNGDDDGLPRDPDLDDLPEELVELQGGLRISGVDPDTGDVHAAPVTREHLAAAFADKRRCEEDGNV